ncbi:methyltransferase domain-containing protein [Pseudonocardia oceani]|uniref:Methyltransferase domain-containing protein n=5 Tax=Pseudonocardia oceani TaxID=2792013 RepID=A0ABS6UGQ6_9PSEU|nr:methyltransferase domain-containing protein [Pseudonocardia oceani]MBW0131039.1 methyltransferase domain-containing protein [Pseudonocardia oceani]
MDVGAGGETAAERWAGRQEGRGIPPEILARAPASPWLHDPSYFVAPEVPLDTPSRSVALDLLDAGGTVLDVGAGGGAASLALAGAVTHLTAVDQQVDMLEVLAAGAAARGIPVRTVRGRWPDAAADAGRADVVLSHHVLHNVVDLPPFLRALTAAAGRGVVVEMLAEHPMAWLDPLWVRFHDLHRPPPATTDDAVAVLRELGVDPRVLRWERASPPKQDPAWVTARLCLPAGREPEVVDALAALPHRRPRLAATLVWRP